MFAAENGFVRRMATGAAVVAAGALVLTSCAGGAGNEGAESGGTVTMWVNPIAGDREAATWEPIVDAFTAENPDIKVDIVVQPWANRDQQLTAAIAGGSGPDVLYMNDFQIPGYQAQGALADLTGVLGQEEKSFAPHTLAAATVDGKLYGAPVLTSVNTTIFNKKVMDAAGIAEADYPTTWAEVLELAPKIKEAGYWVMQVETATTAAANLNFYPFLWSAGGEVLSADGTEPTFNGPEGVEALEFIKAMVDGGYAPTEAITVQASEDLNPVAQGKVAFTFATEASLLTQWGIPEEDLVIKAPLGQKGEGVGFGTVGTLAMLEGSKNVDATKKWIQWVTLPENLATFNLDRGYYSPRADQADIYEEGTLMGQQGQYIDRMHAGVLSPFTAAIETSLIPQLQAALLGRSSVEEALNTAADEVSATIARG